VTSTVWLVDVMNVVGSRPDGWWRNRRAAMTQIVEAMDARAENSSDAVVAVLDGLPFELEADEIEVVFAPGGPNAADAEILRLLALEKRDCIVVTSDRDLADRAVRLGATVVGAGEFRSRLDGTR
jgi:uncharacterized protein YaiI (UPF0178 family)